MVITCCVQYYNEISLDILKILQNMRTSSDYIIN